MTTMTSTSLEMASRLENLGNAAQAAILQRFFKTGPGEYGEGDRFRGIRVPVLRKLAREFRQHAGLAESRELLASPWHEDRLLGLLLLVDRFGRADMNGRREVYETYLSMTSRINNWDLVDLSAPQIVGGHLQDGDRSQLFCLSVSPCLWERRIAIVATLQFIRRNDFDDTIALAAGLLQDREDLIHKASGWMLREVGKRDRLVLEAFLDRYAPRMPRVMLRYAIERFPEQERKRFLAMRQ